MLAWCIISTILLVAALAGITYVTIQWFQAEKKLAEYVTIQRLQAEKKPMKFVTVQWFRTETEPTKSGQSPLYKRIKNNKLYKKCENFFKTHADDNK